MNTTKSNKTQNELLNCLAWVAWTSTKEGVRKAAEYSQKDPQDFIRRVKIHMKAHSERDLYTLLTTKIYE